MMGDYKYLFKILVLGDSGVGKSCLLMRFSDGRFTGKYLCTVGVDFKVRTVEVAGQVVKLQIWDTAGEERFRSVLPAYYRGAHGVLLVYDTTSVSTFRSLDGWLKEIRRRCPDRVNVFLAGNKCDDLVGRQVSQQQATHYADHRELPFREVSAKSGANVNHVFAALAVGIFNRLVATTPPSTRLLAGQDRKVESEDRKTAENPKIRLLSNGRLRSKPIESCC
uniref:Ras-related protein Rab-1A-like n=1 Tax=Drosophila rhopaloa TaxID=1041015 RepID=A0A6P4FMW0_DRORH